MKFGRKQINKPTPASINFWVRGWSVGGLVLIGAMKTVPFHISPELLEDFNWCLGTSVAIANAIAPLFGADINGPVVPIDKVTAVEEEKK